MDVSGLTTKEKQIIAQNPNTPTNALSSLAKEDNYAVRWGVAGNPNTSTDILTILARDSDYRVRRGVLYTHNVSVDMLAALKEESDYRVRADVECRLALIFGLICLGD